MVMIRNMLIISDMGRPSSFTKDQMVNIVLWWGELQKCSRSGGSMRSIMALIVTHGRFLPSGPSKPSSTDSVRPVPHFRWRILGLRKQRGQRKTLVASERSLMRTSLYLSVKLPSSWTSPPRQCGKSSERIVDDFCESLDPEEIRRAVANVRKRAAACIECGGGHFEHLLKRARKDTAEE